MSKVGGDYQAKEPFLQKKIELHASRDQVWGAVATGPGLSAWYVPHELEPRKGGRVRADFGGGVVIDGRILVYERGRRVVYGGGKEQPGVALEFWITEEAEGHPKDATVLHFRQRGFPEADRSLYDRGWDLNFHTLAEYFKHFAGRPATTAVALSLPLVDRRETWTRVHRGLGLDPAVVVGERIELAPEGGEPISGVVDLVIDDVINAVGVRTDDGFYRMMADEQCGAAIMRYTYVVDPPPELRAAVAGNWQGWLDQQFAG